MNKETTETKDALLKKLKALAKEYEDKLAELNKTEPSDRISGKPIIRDITPKDPDEYVEIRLFQDGDKYKDDVLVGINGYMCRIKRGVPVKVKKKFAQIITLAEDNTAKANAELVSRDGKMERYC